MFAKRLKELRIEHNLAQKELAFLLHVSRPTIAGYETKGKQPDYEKIIWLSNYFEVSSDYLLGIVDTKFNRSYVPICNKISEKDVNKNRELEIFRLKFVEHNIIKDNEYFTYAQIDDYLSKLAIAINTFQP